MRILLIILIAGSFLIFAASVLPSSEEDTRHSESGLPYTVYSLKKGETLSHLALAHYGDTSFAAFLAEYNNIANPRRIFVGREIRIPHLILYKIKRGDSLTEIAQNILGSWTKYRVIAEYNAIPDPDFIVAGRSLTIPLIPSLKRPAITPEEVVEREKPEVTEEKIPPTEEEVIEPIEPKVPPPEEVVEREKPEITEEKEPPAKEEVVKKEEVPIPTEEKPVPAEEEEEPEPAVEEKKPEPEEVQEKPILREEEVIPPVRKDLRLTEIKKPEPEVSEIPIKDQIRVEVGPPQPEIVWPPPSIWIQEEVPPEEESTEAPQLLPILEALERWDRELDELSLKELRDAERDKERGVKLPMHSLLQIDGYKSITIEYNKTHYFGDSDINRYSGYYSGGMGSGYGYDSYGSYDSYSSYGSGYGSSYGSGYGSSYGSGFGSGYGAGRGEGPNIQQELDIHLHGRIGLHTHVDVDYNDTGKSQFGGMGRKEQEISVWYEGDEGDIIQRASFGDIRLNLPSSRFLNMSRSLFGAELIMQLGDLKVTTFATRTKGIKGTWSSKGQSRQAGGGTGTRIMDINYIKERYYGINVGEDGMIHDSYLPIETGSEQIYIDDGIGTNNEGGISTARGYFDYQYPGEDYNIDYAIGQIEFLKNIRSSYKIVVAYKYRGDGGGTVGNPDAAFADDDEDGVIDQLDDPADPVGYIVIKESGGHGAELRNVYSLGNRNIGRRNFDLSIWREGGTDSFKTDSGTVLYTRIFGLDSDGDGLVDPELIDFERGLLTFLAPRPFMVDDPNSPYYEYRDELNNEAIYSENPGYTDQKYVIQADYSYQMPSFYIGRLNILPDSEEVKVNNQRLKRGVDYIMVYEVGSVEIFKELDEYDEITIDYEYMPFGGQFQQTIAGVWAEYSFTPREKRKPESQRRQPGGYDDGMSPFSDPYSSSFSQGSGSGYSSGRSTYGDSFDSGYSGYSGSSSYGSSSGRRGRYGSSTGSRRRASRSAFGGSGGEGLKLALGYVYNTGQRTSAIPDVNSAPSRLQAVVFSGNWGHKFDVARVFGLLPFVSLQGAVPLSIHLDGEAAYSRNNPNSVGYAMIDSMEGAKESSRIPTYKFSWQIGSIPVAPDADTSTDNRAVFHIAPRDKDASYGNYMKNRETSAVEINPLAQATQHHLVMEIGYDLDESASWGSLSYALSSAGADYGDYEFLEIWLKVEGNDDLNLHIDLGVVSEDTDDDFRLDSEDLPRSLIDQNGDHKVDILDLDKEDLPEEDKYKGNGRLDQREDTGWAYNDYSGEELAIIGKDNTVLNTEDLDGDVVLDTTNSYYEFTIPLNDIPSEWIRKETRDTGWMFLSIPLEAAAPQGRSPSWAIVKHARLWLEKTGPGSVVGKLLWYSIVVAGNRWEKGYVVNEEGKLSENDEDQLLVGTKNTHEFEDYLKAYKTIEEDKDFEVLHPYVQSSITYESERKEQALTLSYNLEPNSTGYTMRDLSGQRRGDGQDFSKHRNIRLWFHGDGSQTTLIMRLGSNVDDFGAGSPVRKSETDGQDPYGYSSYPSYSSYSRYGAQGYYEYTRIIDFTGWKLISISLEDSDGDGHPDSMESINDPSITNIGQVLVGIENNTELTRAGEVWVNEIHLSDPYIRSGWARRFNFSTALANIFSIRGGYAKQDRNFENSAGQTGRSTRYSMGYSTSNDEYNVDTELTLISWLPIGFSVSHRESESISSLGMISSYDSGSTITDNKTFSVGFDMTSLPSLSFSYDRQTEKNERRGTEISHLYASEMGYSLGSMATLRMSYSHEKLAMADDESDEESDTDTGSYSSSYYYRRAQDAIIDRGGISLIISPIKSFSLNPSYDIRRELEKESGVDGNGAGGYKLAARDQKIYLKPTLRKFLGIRPTVSARYSFNEDWFRDEKDASMTTDLGFGINVAFKSWFAGRKDKKRSETDTTDSSEEEIDYSEEEIEYNEEDMDAVLDEESLREMIDGRMQEDRGNWIGQDKDELKRAMEKRGKSDGKAKKGILRRSLETFSFNTDFKLQLNDYLRRLEPGMGFADIIKLDQESEYRTRSTRSKRYSMRANMDPLTWASLGTNISLTNRFSKTAGTASDSDSSTVGGNVKFSSTRNSLMLKYNMTKRESSNRSGPISNSTSHSQSVILRRNWSSGFGSNLGMRITLSKREGGGVTRESKMFAPNINIDYDLHVEGQMRLPLIGRTIKLDHDLDVSNTFSAMVRRDKLGINRDEKSEQYGTSLDVSYNLRRTIRASLRLAVDYNHDRVEEGADYISISSALMIRGEFK